MPITGLQPRTTRVGAIRIGQQVPTKSGKSMRPDKLDVFRLTSPYRDVIDTVAAQFGGDVRLWQGPKGPEFETITTSRELPILIPPQPLDPNMELWGKGYKARQCDNVTERLRGLPCLCLQSNDHKHTYFQGACSTCGVSESWGGPVHEHVFASDRCEFENSQGLACGARRTCKPTIRMNVMIPDVPTYGVWKVESHGFNTASNLASLAGALENTGRPVPAKLVMVPEERVRFYRPGKADQKVETFNFYALDIIFDWLTPGQVHGGQLESAAAARLTAITQPAPQHAIAAAPERLTEDDVRRLAERCVTLDEVRDLWKRANLDGALTVAAAKLLTAVGDALNGAASVPNAETAEIIDAEPEPDADSVWAQITSAVPPQWGTDGLEQRVIEALGKPSIDANGFELQRFLDLVKSGGAA